MFEALGLPATCGRFCANRELPDNTYHVRLNALDHLGIKESGWGEDA